MRDLAEVIDVARRRRFFLLLAHFMFSIHVNEPVRLGCTRRAPASSMHECTRRVVERSTRYVVAMIVGVIGTWRQAAINNPRFPHSGPWRAGG
jgi:hypothetical protein